MSASHQERARACMCMCMCMCVWQKSNTQQIDILFFSQRDRDRFCYLRVKCFCIYSKVTTTAATTTTTLIIIMIKIIMIIIINIRYCLIFNKKVRFQDTMQGRYSNVLIKEGVYDFIHVALLSFGSGEVVSCLRRVSTLQHRWTNKRHHPENPWTLRSKCFTLILPRFLGVGVGVGMGLGVGGGVVVAEVDRGKMGWEGSSFPIVSTTCSSLVR